MEGRCASTLSAVSAAVRPFSPLFVEIEQKVVPETPSEASRTHQGAIRSALKHVQWGMRGANGAQWVASCASSVS